jgi:hypothetical protein
MNERGTECGCGGRERRRPTTERLSGTLERHQLLAFRGCSDHKRVHGHRHSRKGTEQGRSSPRMNMARAHENVYLANRSLPSALRLLAPQLIGNAFGPRRYHLLLLSRLQAEDPQFSAHSPAAPRQPIERMRRRGDRLRVVRTVPEAVLCRSLRRDAVRRRPRDPGGIRATPGRIHTRRKRRSGPRGHSVAGRRDIIVTIPLPHHDGEPRT